MTVSSLSPGADPRQAFTADQLALIDHGAVEFAEMRRRGFSAWLAAGAAWCALQRQAMYLSNSNQPAGRRYAETYNRLEQPWPVFADIDRNSRKDAIWLYENQQAVLAWFNSAQVTQRDRDRWNHPTTVRKRFEAENTATAAGKPDGIDQRPTALQHAQQQIVDLRAELDTAEAEIRRLKRGSDNVSEGRDWSWTDSADAIADVWLHLHPSKAAQVASKVLEKSKSTAPRKVRRGAVK